MTFDSVDDLLAAARANLRRLTPAQAAAEVDRGAILVDIRPAWQREVDGEIPGALIIERNHLEWRLHPGSGAAVPEATAAATGQRWIVYCTEGYTSSLAAAALVSLRLDATDVIGGIKGWEAAGLPVSRTVTPVETRVPPAS